MCRAARKKGKIYFQIQIKEQGSGEETGQDQVVGNEVERWGNESKDTTQLQIKQSPKCNSLCVEQTRLVVQPRAICIVSVSLFTQTRSLLCTACTISGHRREEQEPHTPCHFFSPTLPQLPNTVLFLSTSSYTLVSDMLKQSSLCCHFSGFLCKPFRIQ